MGTIVSFRIGAEDAEFLEKEFLPEFNAGNFVNLGKYNVYVKLMIDGLSGRPFSALTLPPIETEEESQKEKIIQRTREVYGTKAEIVIAKIIEWAGLGEESNEEGGEKRPAPMMQQRSEEQPLYDAVCASCKKDTKVVFQPDGKRPVYCKKCRKKMQQEKEGQKTEQQPARRTEPVQRQEEEVKKEQKPQPANLSLREAVERDVTTFHTKEGQKKRDEARKEVNTKELKQVLQSALNKQEKEKKGKGVIQPGETVYL
jgi:CxxC-x17-CxxC domain-containing protein